jgi:RNA polymerase sigma-70 factor (ECF subfamily)
MMELDPSHVPDPGAAMEQYRDRICRYVQSLTRSPADAEELTQETFLRAHRNFDSLREAGALSAWLYRIATNVAIDWLRRQPQANRQAGDEEAGSPEELPDKRGASLQTVAEQREMSDCVQAYLEQLSDDYRAVIILHDMEGMTAAEIAQLLGVTVGAVKIRLHRARKSLQAALNAGCDFIHDGRGVLVCEPQPGTKPRRGSS